MYSLSVTLLQPPNLTNVKPGTTYSFLFQTVYTAVRPPLSIQQCNFTATFNFTGSAASDWTVSLFGHPNVQLLQNALTYSFPLSADPTALKVERTTVVIKTPTTPGPVDKSCSFSVAVNAQVPDPTNGLVAISNQAAGSFNVTLKGS